MRTLKYSKFPRLAWGAVLLLAAVAVAPVMAKPSNFGPISLSPGFKPSVKTVTGYANGAIGLHKVVGDRDVNNNRCMGYGSPQPDHVLVLKGNFARLTLKVDSGNKDTTLLLKGPNGKLYCADDAGASKDAALSLKLKSGRYSAWVGTIDPGQKYRYQLKIMR